MKGLFTSWLLLSFLLAGSSRAFLQERSTTRETTVPCLQTFQDFTKNWEVDCTNPCEVVCDDVCYQTFSPTDITGYLYYTVSSPICLAALLQGTIAKLGGSFSVRSSGEMTRFVSGRSSIGGGRSQSSNTTQLSWFIEPYERVRFIQEPEETTVGLGEYLTLYCKVNSRSRPRVTWYNDGQEIGWSTTVDCTGEVCTIQHAEKAHSGTWWCKVETEYSGTLVSRHCTVTVAYLNHTFVYQPRDYHRSYASDGGTLVLLPDMVWPLVLPCSTDSEPRARVSWYKSNKLLVARHVFQVQDGSLYFMTVNETDSGSYKCICYNSVTKETMESQPKRIHREAQARRPGPVPSSIISSTTTSSVFASPGHTVTLTCVARGNPVPTISWSVPPAVERSGRTSSAHFARNYIIKNVRSSDAGEYKCNAENENDYGFGSSFIVRVIVVSAPTFSIVPNDQTYNEGQEAVLRCGLQNRGSLDWLKDGEYVKLNSNIKMEHDFLVIKKMSGDDVGMYQCVAGLMSGENRFVTQSSAFLSVHSPPRIFPTSVEDMVYNGGERVHMRCRAAGFPYPYVTWYKDTNPLVFDERVKMVDVQGIVIENAEGTDYGEYTCVARNSHGTDTLSSLLTVIVKANIESLIASDKRGYYISDDTILLTCTAAGSKELDITWSKDNSLELGIRVVVKQENVVDLNEYVVTESVLEIPTSSVEHEGSYRCSARNYLGSNNKDITIRVFPEAIPPRLMTGPINTVVTDENNLLVSCVFTGVPPPWVTWRKNNKTISEDGRIVVFSSEDGLTSTLLVSDAVTSDGGIYSCEGSNAAGHTARGILPINIVYSDTGGVTGSTRAIMGGVTGSTRALVLTFPFFFYILLLLPW